MDNSIVYGVEQEVTKKQKPLQDIRVVDFSHAAAGPYCTMFLGDLGAEIIKIEKPGRGDGSRFMGEPMVGPKDSDYYLSLNRNKKSVLIDLSTSEGVEIARNLVAQADIVVQNFRPGVMERLGLGYENLRKLRKGLIYCSISAFGSTGPWSKKPANDIIMQSVSGLMGITGEVGGGPVRIGAPISDFSTGLFGLTGILAALHVRDDHPEGQHVEVAMLDASLAMMANYIPSVTNLDKKIERLGRGHAQIVPYQAFVCKDNEYIMVGAFTNGFWRNLCSAVGREEWIEDPKYISNAERLKHRAELLSQLDKIFITKTRDEWLSILEDADVPNSPVYELHDAVKSEQAIYNKSILEVEKAGKVVNVVRYPVKSNEWNNVDDEKATFPPPLGADTEWILGDLLGLSLEDLTKLQSQGVIGLAEGENKS